MVRLQHPFLHRRATDSTRLRRVVRRTWSWKRNRKQQSRAGLTSRRRRWSRRRQPQSGPARRWTQTTLHHNMSFNRSAGTSCAWSKRRISFSGHFFMRRFTFHDELSLKGKSSSSMTEVMANAIHAIKGRHQLKKNVFFRALPELPKPPPPMTPIRATWSSFFGSRNSRFESQFKTKNTIYTI